MSGPSSVNTNNASLFDAFKQLTVGREANRGTLEAVKKGGKVVELKCSQHHFYSGEVKVSQQDSKDMRALLKSAVREELDRAFGRFTLAAFDLDDGPEARASEIKGGAIAKVDAKMEGLLNQLDERLGITGDTRLLRSDIEKIVTSVQLVLDGLKTMSVENLLKAEAKDLLGVLGMFELRSDYSPDELGAKTSGAYQFKTRDGRTVFNRDTLKRDMELFCKGKSIREKFAFALNLFAEKSPSFIGRGDEKRKEYLSTIRYLKDNLSDPKNTTPLDMYLDLTDALDRYGDPRANGNLYDDLSKYLSDVTDVINAG